MCNPEIRQMLLGKYGQSDDELADFHQLRHLFWMPNNRLTGCATFDIVEVG